MPARCERIPRLAQTWVRWLATSVRRVPAVHPATETLRGLLTGTPIGNNAVITVAWSVGIAVASYLWARHLYANRRSA